MSSSSSRRLETHTLRQACQKQRQTLFTKKHKCTLKSLSNTLSTSPISLMICSLFSATPLSSLRQFEFIMLNVNSGATPLYLRQVQLVEWGCMLSDGERTETSEEKRKMRSKTIVFFFCFCAVQTVGWSSEVTVGSPAICRATAQQLYIPCLYLDHSFHYSLSTLLSRVIWQKSEKRDWQSKGGKNALFYCVTMGTWQPELWRIDSCHDAAGCHGWQLSVNHAEWGDRSADDHLRLESDRGTLEPARTYLDLIPMS